MSSTDMDNFGGRVRRLRKIRGMTQADVARAFGVTRAAVLQWERGTTLPTAGKLEVLARVLSTSVSYLLTGDTDKLSHPELSDAPPALREVPIVSYVVAGEFTDISDAYATGDGLDFVSTSLTLGPNTFALIIEGESMLPEFRPGDRIIVDPSATPRPGDFVVARLDAEDRATFKKFRARGADTDGVDIIDLVPLNEDWPTLRIDADNPGRIIATLIEHHRRFRRQS